MKEKMPRRAIAVFIVCSVCFLGFISFSIRPTNIKGLLVLPCILLFFCVCIFSLIATFATWKTSRFWALSPLVACLLVLTAPDLGHFIKIELFNWRFSRYEALVEKVRSGSIPVSSADGVVSATNYDSDLAVRVVASLETNGVLIVVFNYGMAGPPPYHQDYLYISSGVIEAGSHLDKLYWSQAKIKDKWFEVAN